MDFYSICKYRSDTSDHMCCLVKAKIWILIARCQSWARDNEITLL